MAKTPSSRLFDLIKTLSGSEKRYFKLSTKKDADSKYLRLFEAIEEQTIFDDKELKEWVYQGEQVLGKKYSELKSYLYDLILRYLQQFDEHNTVDYKLKNMLLSVRSLFRRLLFKDCDYLLARIKKIALRYEYFSIVLEALQWEKELAYARSNVDYFDKNLEKIRAEEKEYLAKMTQLKTYEGLFYELFLIARTNTPQSNVFQQKIKGLAAHDLLSDQSVAQSFQAQIFFLRIHAILSYQKRELEHFYNKSKELILMIESKPFLLKEDTSHYISALNNVIGSCGFTYRYDELRAYLEKLKKIKPNTKDDELKIYHHYYTNYFRLCIFTGEFSEGKQLLNKHLKEIKKLDSMLFKRNVFFFQYFYICFGAGDFDLALTYLNKWISLPKGVEQKGLQVLAQILNLIVHYEMGNTILLDSMLSSTQRKLQKNKHYNAFEQLLFHCLRQVNQVVSKKRKKELFVIALKKFNATEWTKKERAILRFFAFEAWLLSKAKDKTFAVVIQNKQVN